MKFTKMQGLGNDYVYVNCLKEKVESPSEMARRVSDRHFGVGSDGLILICPSECADFEMKMYNADGSRGEMCGNGIRCFAKYATDHELVKTKVFTVETLAGILTLEIIESDDLTSLVRVNMGSAIYQHESVPLPGDGDKFINQMLEVDGVPYTVSSLFMGTIHTVLFMDNIDEEAAARIGAAIENHPLYPNKTNVNLCKVVDSKNIDVLTWEKGVGITLACGTGSAACALLSQDLYDCETSVTVHVKGGNLLMERVGEEIYMTGPATLICKGQYLYN